MTKSDRAAFFDVDDTLLARAGLWDFLAHHLHHRYGPELGPMRWRRLRSEVRREAGLGTDREILCRRFYRALAGVSVAEAHADGRAWFTEANDGSLFQAPVRRRLSEHVDAGDLVVLVSGSFSACLSPIARDVGADLVVCSVLKTRAGRYTGGLSTAMIGQAKEAAVRSVAAAHGVDLRASFAYGDHSSDLPMLRAVGHPVVVGNDPTLIAAGLRQGEHP